MLRMTSLALLVCTAATTLAAGMTTASATLLGIYEDFKGVNCASSKDCFVVFKKVAADTKISKVSCNFYILAQNASLTEAVLGQSTTPNKNGFVKWQFLMPINWLDFDPTFTQFQILADTLHVIPGGQFPVIQISYNVAAASVANCSIAGTTSALLPGAKTK